MTDAEIIAAMEQRLVQAQEERKLWRGLLDRAAELLRLAVEGHYIDNDRNCFEWMDKRDQWLKDAGMEK